MDNSEESPPSESERSEEQRNPALALLSNLSTMISNASIILSESTSSRESSNATSQATTTYDKTLAAKHEYLGTDLEEVRGRTLHDEGSIVWLPILMELEVVLVPGQTLPLTAFYPPTISMFRKIIAEDKTFGVVCVSSLAPYGTTAEIFQYQEDNDLAGFKIKAKGRQRFKLLEEKRQTPGTLFGKVLILPEISLVSPLHCSRFTCLDKYRNNSAMKSKLLFYDSSPTSWPSWVYKQYDTRFLVEKVTEELKNLKSDVYSSSLPTDPLDLSYWVAQCLPIDGINRIKMLSFNTAIERLQYALTLMSKGQKFYCAHCGNCIADRKDVFSMSIDGPQGMYCNPGGHVHEIITVYKGLGMSLANEEPSTDYSWFPGYGWTIAQCSNCDCHMGWLFTAMKGNLKPMRFWGLSRRSVTTHQKENLQAQILESVKQLQIYYYYVRGKKEAREFCSTAADGQLRSSLRIESSDSAFDLKGSLRSSCETQGPSGSKHGSAKGTPARKRKTSDKNKFRKNSTDGPTPSQSTRGGIRVYKIVVLGDGGVGKSALTLQFVSHSFSEYHDPTIEDAYQQQAVIDGEAALLDILDTAGQIEFNAMRDQYMRCGEGFIICYSVTDRHSFQEAVEYKKLINKVRASEDIPLILIGNKCDLQHQRKVTLEEGQALAQQFGCPFFETSAALRHFVDDAFHTLIREIRAKEKGRNSADKFYISKWKRLRSIFSVIFRKKSHYSF